MRKDRGARTLPADKPTSSHPRCCRTPSRGALRCQTSFGAWVMSQPTSGSPWGSAFAVRVRRAKPIFPQCPPSIRSKAPWLCPSDVLAVLLSLWIWSGVLGAENLPGNKQVPFLKLNLISCRRISTEPFISSRCPSSLSTPQALTCRAGDAASGRLGPSTGKIITAASRLLDQLRGSSSRLSFYGKFYPGTVTQSAAH